MSDDPFGILADAGDEAGAASGQPRKPHEVEPGLRRDAALMQRVALSVELGIEDPAEIHAVARSPDDRAHPGCLEVELVYRGDGSRFGYWAELFRRGVDAVELDVGIDAPFNLRLEYGL